MNNEFNWHDEQGESVVWPTTKGVAAYENEEGDIVLRQQGDFRTDYEDVVIIVPRNHLDDLILALQLLKP